MPDKSQIPEQSSLSPREEKSIFLAPGKLAHGNPSEYPRSRRCVCRADRLGTQRHGEGGQRRGHLPGPAGTGAVPSAVWVEESDFLVFYLFFFFKMGHFNLKVWAGDAHLCPTKLPRVSQGPSVPKIDESGKGKCGSLKTLHFRAAQQGFFSQVFSLSFSPVPLQLKMFKPPSRG